MIQRVYADISPRRKYLYIGIPDYSSFLNIFLNWESLLPRYLQGLPRICSFWTWEKEVQIQTNPSLFKPSSFLRTLQPAPFAESTPSKVQYINKHPMRVCLLKLCDWRQISSPHYVSVCTSLKWRNISVYSGETLWAMRKIARVKCFGKCLTHSKPSINASC